MLADIFFKAGLIEAWGRGTIKITDECNNAGLLEPEFKEEFGGFAVYFFKDIYTEDILKKTGLNERQIIAVKYIKKHGSINLSDLKNTASLEKLFIHKIFKMLLSKGLITERVIELISSWRHTGFGVYCGKRTNPNSIS